MGTPEQLALNKDTLNDSTVHESMGSSLNKHDKVVDSPAAEAMKDSLIAGATPSKPTAIVKPNSEMSKEEVSENKSDDVIETLDEKTKKKVLPPKPWLRNKKKSEVNEEEK